MRKITAFNFLSINGFFKGKDEDISWHMHGAEGNKYSEEQLLSGNILLFGRKTYLMMADFWTTKMASDHYPLVAERMNSAEKIVLSTTLTQADWNNTKIINENAIDQIRRLKSTPGKNISILGSGAVITRLTEAGLIDEYEFLIDPVAIGEGTPVFNNCSKKINLELVSSRVFKISGAVLLTYKRIE